MIAPTHCQLNQKVPQSRKNLSKQENSKKIEKGGQKIRPIRPTIKKVANRRLSNNAVCLYSAVRRALRLLQN